MEILEVDFNDKKLLFSINKFLSTVSSVDVKQTPEWFKVRNEKGFAIYGIQGSEIVSYCNLFVDNGQIYIPRGPIVFDDKIFSNCLACICDYVKKLGYEKIKLNPKINSRLKINKRVEYVGKDDFSLLKESYREAIVNLAKKTEEDLLNGFRSTTRHHIRRALKNDLIVCVENIMSVDEFYPIYIETSMRHNFKPHSKQYFADLIEGFKDKIICCKIKLGTNIIAMSLNILQGDTFFYLYGASSSQYNKLYATYLMHWTMIKYALNNGFDFYNFGGVFAKDYDVNNKDYGLLLFKSGFCNQGFIEYISDMIISL